MDSEDHLPCLIAVHCSGADSGQWRGLSAEMGPAFEVLTPNLIGAGNGVTWPGTHPFTLLDEARTIIDMIDVCRGEVHLVGHSYGGAVVLKAASARPDRVASLFLYEPVPFHILRDLGSAGDRDLAEIEALAGAVTAGLLTGAYQAAAENFVNYWAGAAAWQAMNQGTQAGMIGWLRKAPLEFRAVLHDDTPLADYRRIAGPALVMRGEAANAPCRRMAEALAGQLPCVIQEILPGAGHMGPMTHAAKVQARIAAHVRAASARASRASVALVA